MRKLIKQAFPKTDREDKLTLMLIRGRLLAISTRKYLYMPCTKYNILPIFYTLKWKQPWTNEL